METSPHCTVSWRRRSADLPGLLAFTAGVVLAHGYHPWAEDGGLYVAGVEYLLDPTLFPHDRAFVTAHLGYSVFAPLVAGLVRHTGASLAAVLFALYLFSTALTLFAVLRLAEACLVSRPAQWTAVALLAAWWTLPIAGTSLLLMDPYLTARSFSTPLGLLAVAAALRPWPPLRTRAGPDRSPAVLPLRNPALHCGAALLLAALVHPLMAGYAVGLVIAIRLVLGKMRPALWAAIVACVVVLAATLLALAHPESASVVAAAYSRYYWFLSRWEWFEWMGLLGPPLILAACRRWGGAWLRPRAFAACTGGIADAALAFGVALLFAQRHFGAHPVARLQPLRSFLLLYVLMIVMLAGALVHGAGLLARKQHGPRAALVRGLPGAFVTCMAVVMFFVQRSSFPASLHIEFPSRPNPNPWVQAFLWAREHTPRDTLFALDARYVNTEGEDAQVFRALAQRSMVPDFSKDGGEAAITPSLAPDWLKGAAATRLLSESDDLARDRALAAFGTPWLVLHADTPTARPCPYQSRVVKVCRPPGTYPGSMQSGQLPDTGRSRP